MPCVTNERFWRVLQPLEAALDFPESGEKNRRARDYFENECRTCLSFISALPVHPLARQKRGSMFSTPYIGGKTIEVPPSAFSDVINPANHSGHIGV